MKKKPIPSKTANDWLAVLAAANVKTPDIVPAGFATIEQIAEETGKSVTTSRQSMKAAIKSGVVEAQKFLVAVGHKTYPTTHYRIL
jgi:predicted transcriptional regulator